MRWWSLLLFLFVVAQLNAGEAAEYRLQVVSIREEVFSYYMKGGEGFGAPLVSLESALEAQKVPKSVVLTDRPVYPARPSQAQAFEASPFRVEPLTSGNGVWSEFRWVGDPGSRTLWVVETRTLNLHEVSQLGLKGTGPLRHVFPYGASMRVRRTEGSSAVRFPADLVDFWNGRPGLWARQLSRYLDLADGIAAVVAMEPYPDRPDRVYLVIQQPAEPRTFKVVLAWRKREGAFKNLFEGATGGPGGTR